MGIGFDGPRALRELRGRLWAVPRPWPSGQSRGAGARDQNGPRAAALTTCPPPLGKRFAFSTVSTAATTTIVFSLDREWPASRRGAAQRGGAVQYEAAAARETCAHARDVASDRLHPAPSSKPPPEAPLAHRPREHRAGARSVRQGVARSRPEPRAGHPVCAGRARRGRRVRPLAWSEHIGIFLRAMGRVTRTPRCPPVDEPVATKRRFRSLMTLR